MTALEIPLNSVIYSSRSYIGKIFIPFIKNYDKITINASQTHIYSVTIRR